MVNMKNGETNWKIQYCLRRRWQHCPCYVLVLFTIRLTFLYFIQFFSWITLQDANRSIDVCILELFRTDVIPKVVSFLFIYLSPSQNDIHSVGKPGTSLIRSDWYVLLDCRTELPQNSWIKFKLFVGPQSCFWIHI